nr:hypothetical protein [Pseudomonadota bacterium]
FPGKKDASLNPKDRAKNKVIDAWKIGVLLKLETNALGVLGLLGAKLGATDKEVKHLTSSFGNMGAAATVAGLAAGAASIKLTEVLLRNGDKIIKQRALMSAAGVSPAGIAAMTSSSKSIANTTPGTTPSEIMHLEQELRSNLGTSALAIKAAGQIAKDHVALVALFPQFKGAGLDIFKTIDLMGGAMKNGHLSASAMASSYLKILQFEAATSGQVSASTLRRVAQTGGFALQGVPLGSSLSGLAATILELGSRAGTGIGAAAMQLEGGNASLKTVTGMERYGLIGKGGYTHKDGHYAVKAGALYGYHDLVTKGIADWITKDLVPKLKSEGVHTAPQMIAALSQILGSVRAARFLMTLSTPTGQEQAARDKALVHKAFGSDPSVAAQTTLAQNLKNVDAAFETLWQTLGEPKVATAVSVLRGVTDGILYFDKTATAHSHIANDLTDVAIAFGAWAGFKATSSIIVRGLTILGGDAAIVGSFASFASGIGEVVVASIALDKAMKLVGRTLGDLLPDWFSTKQFGGRHIAKQHGYLMPGEAPFGGVGNGLKWHHGDWNLNHYAPGHRYGADPQDGDIHNQSWIPSQPGGVRVQHVTYVQLDRKTIAKAVSEDMAHDMSLPSSGPTRFDSRMTPSFPQHTIGI